MNPQDLGLSRKEIEKARWQQGKKRSEMLFGKSNRRSLGFTTQIKTGVGNIRNRPCPCGSPLKYKVCHLPIEQGWAKMKSADGRTYYERATMLNKVAYNLGNIIGGK